MKDAALTSALTHALGMQSREVSFVPVYGGDINRTYRMECGDSVYFIKTNSASQFPGMFAAEAAGLRLLKDNCSMRVPEPLAEGQEKDVAWLVMEYIGKGGADRNSSFRFGEMLGEMHRVTSGEFGLGRNNFIGSLPQNNAPCASWSEFFVSRRIEPLVKRAFDGSLMPKGLLKHFSAFYTRSETLFPHEKPSLLHGDLWSGNYMYDKNGTPCIYDPAVYFGHREMDLSMTRLFGGFPDEFYNGYSECFPPEMGWRERSDFCNLYPLLVHLNLFGSGYLSGIEQIIRKF